jgi:hypothetical protein
MAQIHLLQGCMELSECQRTWEHLSTLNPASPRLNPACLPHKIRISWPAWIWVPAEHNSDGVMYLTISDPWRLALCVYCIALLASSFSVLQAVFRKVQLKPGGSAFGESPHFSADAKKQLEQHYSRLQGTLLYWKNQAAKYQAMHYFCLFWTIPSAVVIPILTQSVSDANGSKLLLTVISASTAILLSFHSGLKVEDSYKAFRHGESEFYDMYRRLLDRPWAFGESEKAQLEKYFEDVESLRRFIRNAETKNLATLDEARERISQNGTFGGPPKVSEPSKTVSGNP